LGKVLRALGSMHRGVSYGSQPSSSEGIEIIARACHGSRADEDRDVTVAILIEILDTPRSTAVFVDGDLTLNRIAHHGIFKTVAPLHAWQAWVPLNP
jgi:hypothetical protein